ncbi:hypothetical protein ElyMa_005354000 [Elysia marginata]|uniref:Reverse transcriptase domain-containing protein n=1 Tax=Elysia marginata TaxID=1093978 RepID=A0AAV4ECE6_9GAST|nr:hypothetical protein ElyMa_005354000 [Elysia marginata]
MMLSTTLCCSTYPQPVQISSSRCSTESTHQASTPQLRKRHYQTHPEKREGPFANGFSSTHTAYKLYRQKQQVPQLPGGGVPQGGWVLSPILFLYYINDITEELPDRVEVSLLIVDDLEILVSSEDPTTEVEVVIQEALHVIEKWTQSWEMTINVDKCEAIHFMMWSKEIFTDGSTMDGTDYCAGGVYIKTNDDEMSLDIAAGRYSSSYRAESVDFHAALEWLVENNRVRQFNIFTDSRSLVQKLHVGTTQF